MGRGGGKVWEPVRLGWKREGKGDGKVEKKGMKTRGNMKTTVKGETEKERERECTPPFNCLLCS